MQDIYASSLFMQILSFVIFQSFFISYALINILCAQKYFVIYYTKLIWSAVVFRNKN